jgi:hypothetical protein
MPSDLSEEVRGSGAVDEGDVMMMMMMMMIETARPPYSRSKDHVRPAPSQPLGPSPRVHGPAAAAPAYMCGILPDTCTDARKNY